MALYLKVFLATGLPFGALAVVLLLPFGLDVAVVFGALAGLFFGGTMSLILVTLHLQVAKRVQTEPGKTPFGVHQSRHVDLAMPYDTAFDLCGESLQRVGGHKIQEQDRERGRIVAKTAFSWKSSGEIITFSITSGDANHASVEISSRPVMRTALADYGKNAENVERIKSFLRERMQLTSR